jgi:DNA polymerase-3 subunit delta
MIRLLTGENEFALLEEQRRRIAEFLVDNDAFGIERLDAAELDIPRLRDALLQLPFLVQKKLVVIKNVFAVKLIQDTLLDLLHQVPEEIDVLLIDPKSDKRTRLYKELSAHKQVSEYAQLKGSALEKWVVEYASQKGGTISNTTARYLIDRVGDGQMLLARELEKLSVFGTIDRQLVDTHTEQALRSTVFNLLDKIFAHNTDDALRLYDALLATKTDPSEILSLIGWQLHVFALVKYAGSGTGSDIAKLVGIHPYVAGKALQVVQTMSAETVKESVRKTLMTDEMIKTSPVDPRDAVRVLLLQLGE